MAAAPKVAATSELADMEGRVRRLILERLHIEVPANDTDLFSTGIINSLGLVELLLGLREELGIDIDVGTVDLDVLSSIERIALFVDPATLHRR